MGISMTQKHCHLCCSDTRVIYFFVCRAVPFHTFVAVLVYSIPFFVDFNIWLKSEHIKMNAYFSLI